MNNEQRTIITRFLIACYNNFNNGKVVGPSFLGALACRQKIFDIQKAGVWSATTEINNKLIKNNS